MAKKVTDELAREMLEMYDRVGVYAQVAREFGVSASTASRHIKRLQSLGEKVGVKVNLKLSKDEFNRLEKRIESFSAPVNSLSLLLTDNEKTELKELGVLYE